MYNFNKNSYIGYDTLNRNVPINEQLRIKHLNQEQKELITQICLDFWDIFYLAETNWHLRTALIILLKLKIPNQYSQNLRYPQIHKEEDKTQVEKMLIQLSFSSQSLTPGPPGLGCTENIRMQL